MYCTLLYIQYQLMEGQVRMMGHETYDVSTYTAHIS